MRQFGLLHTSYALIVYHINYIQQDLAVSYVLDYLYPIIHIHVS